MKIRTTHLGIILLGCFTLFVSAPGFVQPTHAQTYYLLSNPGLPFPDDPYDGAEPIIVLDVANKTYQINDNTNTYALIMEAHQLDAMSASITSADSLPAPDDGTNSGDGEYTNGFQPLVFGPNDLVIQITNVDLVNQQATLFLTNTVYNEHYQLLYTNTLGTNNGESWTLGEVVFGAFDTNVTPFDTFNIGTNSQMFFRGHHANPVLEINWVQNAIEPNSGTGDPGQTGIFFVRSYYPLSNDLPVYYSIGGTAQNGIDYQTLPGKITLSADGGAATNLFVVPLNDNRADGAEPVTLTLLQNTNYLIDPNSGSATLYVEDSSTIVSVVTVLNNFDANGDAVEPNGPPTEPAQIGQFDFKRNDPERGLYPDMVAYFVISGTASNGIDYTYITNTVDFTNGITEILVDVTPLAQTVFDGTKSVAVTLIPTNTYLVDSNNPSATLDIFDSSTTVSVDWGGDAIETNAITGVGVPGVFKINRTDSRGLYPPLTVQYTLSGTAANGVDYQFLSRSVTFADGPENTSTNIFINTIEEDLIEPDESVILTLATNGTAYYVSSNMFQTNLTIHTTVGFGTVASNLGAPIGVDYYEPSNALIVSETGGELFDMIRTNTATNVVVTSWSSLSASGQETYLAIPRMPSGVFTNSAGFTNGTMFFGSDTNIGWVAPGGTNFNLAYCSLTNPAITNALLLRGGLCMDQTGTFSNELIVVTSNDNDQNDGKTVWRVDAHGRSTLIKQVLVDHFEGVAVLTNDVNQWGPWAGKIITGDELALNFYTIDTNGMFAITDTRTMVPGGISVESVQVIPPNSSLYVADFNNGAVEELPAAYFRNHIGDLLVEDGGEPGTTSRGFYIIHWNAQGSNFVTTQIPVQGNIINPSEGTAFAPVQLPMH